MLDVIIGFVVGILSSMGFGGGSILLLYLTLVKDVEHKNAAGINLLFFLPCALISTVMYKKQKMTETGIMLPLMITSAVGAIGGATLALFIGAKYIRIGFAVILLAIGVKDLFAKDAPK